MAEETKKTTTLEADEVVVVSNVPVAKEPVIVVEVEKEAPPQPEPSKPAAEEVVEAEKEKDEASSEEKNIDESSSFKEESNMVDDLIDPEKKALDDIKL